MHPTTLHAPGPPLRTLLGSRHRLPHPDELHPQALQAGDEAHALALRGVLQHGGGVAGVVGDGAERGAVVLADGHDAGREAHDPRAAGVDGLEAPPAAGPELGALAHGAVAAPEVRRRHLQGQDQAAQARGVGAADAVQRGGGVAGRPREGEGVGAVEHAQRLGRHAAAGREDGWVQRRLVGLVRGVLVGHGVVEGGGGGPAEAGEDQGAGDDEEFSVDLVPDLDGEAEERERHCLVRGCMGFLSWLLESPYGAVSVDLGMFRVRHEEDDADKATLECPIYRGRSPSGSDRGERAIRVAKKKGGVAEQQQIGKWKFEKRRRDGTKTGSTLRKSLCRRRVSPDRSSHRELNAVAFAGARCHWMWRCRRGQRHRQTWRRQPNSAFLNEPPKKGQPRRNRIRILVDAAR